MLAIWLLLPLLLFVGWILGIVGFFRTRGIRDEIEALRRTIAELRAAHTAPPPDAPLVEPVFVPSPEPPAIATTPMPAPQTRPEPKPPVPSPDLETMLTTRWGVWLGSAALVLAGVFLVRYAVDQGLLGPAVRCVLAGLLGLALIAAAEWLRGREIRLPTIADHAAPGLAAGGVAVLFGASYGAGVLYGLVSPLTGFVLMAAAALIGLALSLRHGQLVAAVGLLGAFVTPALVQTEHPSLPGLFAYLLFVTATALAVVRYTAWIWLGWASTIAGAIWVSLAILGETGNEAWAPALFAPATAALNLTLLPGAALEHPVGRYLVWLPCAALGTTGLLLAALDQGWDTRIGLLLFAPLTIWKAAHEKRLRLLPHLAAVLFLLLLATWSIAVTEPPDFSVLPNRWLPPVVQSLLATAAFVSGCFAASGLWFERRSAQPLAWASLTASVPVLALLICYARVADFRPLAGWAAFAVLLAVGLTGAAAAAMREQPAGQARAGVHAAGAVAALALGCAMLLRDQWLTVAVSLFLPALAWITAKADLPSLRLVALAVAAVVLVRLLLNWYALDYGLGQWPVVNDLLAAYALPAAAFALAAVIFRRAGDDLTVGVLEAGGVAFATVLVALEVHQWFRPTTGPRTPPLEFAESALQVASLAVQTVVTLRIAERLHRRVLHAAWQIQGALALFGGVLLLVTNPAVTNLPVGGWPLLDWLLPAYLLPALLAVVALRETATEEPSGHLRTLLAGYALVAGFAWLTLEVRHLFNPGPLGLQAAPVRDGELWAWSGAWLAYGVAVMAIGIMAGSRRLRLAALAIVALAGAKVFLVDMSGLVGLLRVLSFLGLGLVLIGLGAVYRRLVAPTPPRHA